jgi:hypothetical protein
MKENLKVPGKNRRKSYTKPKAKRVQLRPEEAILGGCKINGPGGGPFQADCHIPVNCRALGTS